MSQVELNQKAPDFELEDKDGNIRKLSALTQHGHVLIVLNRGFG